MNTRSRARADQEVRRNIEKQRRIERRQRFESRESLGAPYNLRRTMGRRGVNSGRGTSRGSKGEKTSDVSAVVPIVLFPVSEEDNTVDKGGSQVLFICNPNDILLCAKIMLTSITDTYKSWDPLTSFFLNVHWSCNLSLVWDFKLVWSRRVEQGVTQTQLQPGAASSASTTDHSEEQVCKDCFQLVTFRVYNKFYFEC